MIEKIKSLIVNDLDINVSEDEFDASTPLFEDGLAMDSIVFTEFVVLLEKTFDVEFDDDALSVERFFNINTISESITQLKA